MGLLAPIFGGALGWASGVAGNFGHQFCNRFYQRAGAYSEKIWGLDENEHIARGLRRAEIKATRELLRLWRTTLPLYDASHDDGSHAFAKLLAEWCDAQDSEKAIKQWASGLREGSRAGDSAALRKAFETAYGAEIDARDSMARRAAQARGLALQTVFEDALEGALSLAQRDRARSIRDSDGLAAFTAMFFREPGEGGGWFNVFLIALGGEFKADGEFKRLWDSVQLGGISAMLLDDIELSGERHAELKQFVQRWGDGLSGAVADVKADTEAILRKLAKQEEMLLAIARDKGVEEAPLREILKMLGEAEVPSSKIAGRLRKAADELLQLRADLARLRNDRPEFAAIRAKALALIDEGQFDAARAELRGGRDSARALREEISRSEAGFLLDEARVDRLQLNYDEACKKFSEAARLDPQNCWISIELGDLWVVRGFLAEAERAFEQAAVAARTGGNKRDLSVSYNRIGDVLVAQGNLAEALKNYGDGLAIVDRLAEADAGNAGWQHDLAVSYDKIGNVLVAQGSLAEALQSFRASHDISERLAKADPDDTGWQRDMSVSYTKIGDVLVAQGNLAEALKSFRDDLAIADRLAKTDPGNTGWQRDLSVSYAKIGAVLVAQGSLAKALQSFRAAHDISERLAKADVGNAGWQRDLSVSYGKIGDVLVAQGNLADALKSVRDGLAIAERLAKADASNAGWQYDLSMSYERVGDVLVAQGNLADALKNFGDGLAIREGLAKADAGNTGWQRGLSVSYNKIGDVLVAQGNLADALKNFGEGLAIRERLSKADAGNAGWQRDLSVSYNKIGEALLAQGNLAEALKSFRDDLAIAGRLAKADPDNIGWQYDLSASYAKLGLLYLQMGDLSQSRSALVQGREILARLVADHPGFVQWERDLPRFDDLIAETNG
jgi:tetratricopeptide (TPR) repeat protein